MAVGSWYSAARLEPLDIGPLSGEGTEAECPAPGESGSDVPLDLEALHGLVIRQPDLMRDVLQRTEPDGTLVGDHGRHVGVSAPLEDAFPRVQADRGPHP